MWLSYTEQSWLYEQQTAEFTRVHDPMYRGDPARDIGIGADGSVWIVKVGDDHPDGYELFYWDGWDLVAEGSHGVGVTVDPDGQPWVVTREGRIRRKAGDTWHTFPGRATDISVGADGTAWCIGVDQRPGGFEVRKWDGSAWNEVPGGAGVRIAVAPDGLPWIVNDQGGIFRYLGRRWHRVLGAAIDIAFGADGNCWIAGADGGRHGGNGVYRWNGREWDMTDGAVIRIGVMPNGMPWLVNFRGGVYPRHIER